MSKKRKRRHTTRKSSKQRQEGTSVLGSNRGSGGEASAVVEGRVVAASSLSAAQVVKKSRGARLRSWVSEVLAVGIWTYATIKVWVFDVDTFLVERLAPGWMWILQYKFLFLLAFMILAAVFTKKWAAIGWVIYICFYPVVVVGKVAYFIFRQRSWSLALTLVNAIVAFFRSFKYSLVVTSGFLLCWAGAIFAENRSVLLVTFFVLAGLLVIVGARAFALVFKPSSIFRLYQQVSQKAPAYVSKTLSGKGIPRTFISRMTEAQLQEYRGNLQRMLIWNRGLLFVARKLEAYMKSGFNAATYVLTIVLLFGIIVVSFAAMSQGLYKIDANTFTVTTHPTFSLFLYHSLRSFLNTTDSKSCQSGGKSAT